ISELRKRDRAPPNVARWVARTPAEEIGTSIIILAEIRRGIEVKRRRDPERARSLDRWFGQMPSRRPRASRRRAIAGAWAVLGISNPLPLIDGLLAATAEVHGLTLVTRNVDDFLRTGVSVVDPFST